MKRIYYLMMGFVIVCQSCTAQGKPPIEIYNKDFNWRITIPESFDTVNAEQWTKLKNKGTDAIEKTYDQKIENRTKTLFVFKSEQLNYFESNYQPFDTAIDGNYLETSKNINDMMYETSMAQMKGIKIDTATYTEKIDNLEFQTFKMNITYPNNMVLHMLMFSRLFDKREFSVNIMYVDKTKGELMLNSWKKSKFGHN